MSFLRRSLGVANAGVWGAALAIATSACPALADSSWLTQPEQEFFEAFGVDARVNGTSVKRWADLKAWPGIAKRAQQPLQGRITAISAAFERMPATDAERKRLEEIQTKLQVEIQKQMQGVVIGALIGRDSFDQARDSTAGIMNAGDANGPYVRQAWDLQKKLLERGLESRKTADKNLKEITDALERRTNKLLPTDDFQWSMMSPGKTVSLYGRVGDRPLKSPVVQLVLFRNSTGGQWGAANGMSSALGFGLDVMKVGDVQTGTELSLVQEEAMNLPLVSTFVLPNLEAGSRVSVDIDLPVAATLAIQRAELHVWTDQGTLHVQQVAGLDAIQRRAAQDREKERVATQGQPGPLRQMFQPPAAQPAANASNLTKEQEKALAQQNAAQEAMANNLLKMAKNAIANKNEQMAKYYLQDVIRRAPESAAARTAKRLLKKYE